MLQILKKKIQPKKYPKQVFQTIIYTFGIIFKTSYEKIVGNDA